MRSFVPLSLSLSPLATCDHARHMHRCHTQLNLLSEPANWRATLEECRFLFMFCLLSLMSPRQTAKAWAHHWQEVLLTQCRPSFCKLVSISENVSFLLLSRTLNHFRANALFLSSSHQTFPFPLLDDDGGTDKPQRLGIPGRTFFSFTTFLQFDIDPL